MSDFTPKQKKVIELRNRDILVSAAAGSGKTTVLVERIIQKITDEKDPVDIDRILVVTFTRAAAREMREKIRTAIDEAQKKDPENERLMRQASFVFHAKITTIDAFCNDLLKNYFHKVGAEPDFRIGDARELSLLSSEVMDGMMEEYYAAGEPAFKRLIDTYNVRNRDDSICNMILDLYRSASAAPWPEEWLGGLLSDYLRCRDWDEKSGDPQWLDKITAEARRLIADAYDMASENLRYIRTEMPGCPYEAAVASDVDRLGTLVGMNTFDELRMAASGLSFERLSTKRFDEPVDGFKDRVKAKRDGYKDIMAKVSGRMLFQSRTEAIEAMLRVGDNVETLVELTLDYSRRFMEKKQEKNVFDFPDVEHLALDILIDPETKEPTETALELREFYDEVLIDEYQDSNYLQETILRTISKEDSGDNNYFMVGDIKQSIYGFRQARPEIFAGKYESFSLEDSKQQRIDLDKNFRSRREVIESVNAIFAPIMDKSVGGVDYDEAASLKFGAEYLLPASQVDYSTELLLAKKDDEDIDEELGVKGFDAEGRMIATRIKALMKDFLVFDKETKSHRPLRYSDIVILLRGVKGRGTELMETLMSFGLPAHVTDETGYFDTIEVDTMLSLLSVLDNPRQDIPVAALMRSPIFSFTNEELAIIRGSDRDTPFYRLVFSYEGGEKHGRFLEFIDRYRKLISDTPIHKLLQMIYNETGYQEYVRALPGGELRAANLDRLIDMAVDFEKTSFRGCFKFVNYIRQLKKYNQDVGTADLIGEEDDAIRIMTIHKSKGLEFPVVFLSGIKKKFNMSDASGTMVLSSAHGLALEDIETKRRIKTGYLYRSYLSDRITADMLGEEMRILYVALTRAKEKLIITGTFDDKEDFEKYKDRKLTYFDRISARCYGDFLYPSIFSGNSDVKVKRFTAGELVFDETESEIKKVASKEDIMVLSSGDDDGVLDAYDTYRDFTYPEAEVSFKAKYSVSELKHRSMEGWYEKDAAPIVREGTNAGVSFDAGETAGAGMGFDAGETADAGMGFDSGEGVNEGALRGTMMHLFMEHFDFTKASDEDAVASQIELMIKKGHMSEEQAALLDRDRLEAFLSSPLCSRMSAAAAGGWLFREKPFVMGDDPKSLLGEYYPDEKLPSGEDAPTLLVQGIIDAYFVEGDDIILVDYKTDHVSEADTLIGRYKKQMELYADALSRGFSKKVTERIIYSFALNTEVVI